MKVTQSQQLENCAFSSEMLSYIETFQKDVNHKAPFLTALKTDLIPSQIEYISLCMKIIKEEAHYQFNNEKAPSKLYQEAVFQISKIPEYESQVTTYTNSKNIAFEYTGDISQIFDLFEKCARYSEKELFQMIHQDNCYELLYFITSFERFLHTKFLGQKRFSIEGSESCLFLLFLLKTCFFQDKTSLTVGMSHRGRINAMASVFEKPLVDIFQEFLQTHAEVLFPSMGDVKYHKGYSKHDEKTGLTCTLLPNSSHLESVYPIVLGHVRREKDLRHLHAPIIFHGDAAITGQGIVYEALEMQKLEAYQVGGSIHIIIDNQVGFTANPDESRSTLRPTDVFRTFSNPIIHVRDESPLDIMRAAFLAYQIRAQYGIDVAIRVLGVRKWGHNEIDDPTLTQPALYKKIETEHKPAYEYFKEQVNILSDVQSIQDKVQTRLQNEYQKALSQKPLKIEPTNNPNHKFAAISIEKTIEKIRETFEKPSGFTLHINAEKLLDKRISALKKEGGKARIDWAFAEKIACILMLEKEKIVRVVGQDVERGTFSQRHAVFVDQATNNKWIPLQSLGRFHIYNSHLSEYAALAFEYGYTIQNQMDAISLWEAQFGDFVNGAQIVIDQYISAGFEKWATQSNLVLLLPHGYEGQGPEHSSGRLERFLSLSHDRNMTIAYPSYPDTYVKLLRRQIESTHPLIIMTPKSMLRDLRATSSLDECLDENFTPIRELYTSKETVTTLVMTTGKFSIELSDVLLQQKITNTTLISIEVLSPFPEKEILEIYKKHSSIKTVVWAQEEPINMSALNYICQELEKSSLLCDKKFLQYGRKVSASPATGYPHVHTEEEKALEQAILQGIQS